MKIYIAGKVTGTNRENCIAKFASAKREIELMGVEAINPIEVVKDSQTEWHPAMRMCIAAMMQADAVYLLADWVDSDGARIERILADDLGMPAFTSIKYLQQWINEKS